MPLSELIDDLLPGALLLYASPIPMIVSSAIATLSALVQSLDQRQQLESVNTMKHAVNALRASCRHSDGSIDVPGLKDPKVSDDENYFMTTCPI
jgi:hypothetical protein